MQLKDEAAVITGSGKGIGNAIALGFAGEGT
jgi:NAD(P)-dependent dehydrogenase (short-subunit alcohol dehydrogenase family)